MENQEIESMVREPARMKWACRRGMLELDVLLGNFLDKGFNQLVEDDKRLFVELLHLQDPELFALLMGQVISPDSRVADLVERIRVHARG